MPKDRDPLDLAARALRSRDRSRRDLDERLDRAGVGEEARAETLETLERIGYLDEKRFAAARAANLADRGRGDAAIRFALEQEGLAGVAVEDAIAALAPERERAIRLAAAGGRSRRTAARLQRLGFGEDAVEAAVGGAAEVFGDDEGPFAEDDAQA